MIQWFIAKYKREGGDKMKIKIKTDPSRYKRILDRLKPITINFYAFIGVVAAIVFIAYTLNECLRELYEPKTITISRPNDTEVESGDTSVAEGDEPMEDILVAEVSAYTSSEDETDTSPFLTADGTNLKKVYECTVATNDHDFGTKLAIEDVGVCTVHDRMNSRYTNSIDIYMGNDKQRAIEFGRRELSYIVIE